MKLSDQFTKANTLRTTVIIEIIDESPTVKIYIFKDKQSTKAKPGQFLMLWIPEIDEIPLSILSATEEGIISVAVKAIGDATHHLHAMKPGTTIGIRGPYGNSFTQNQGNTLLIGGGTGTAPILFLAKTLLTNKTKKITIITGAKTKNELLFTEQLDKICQEKNKLITTTNDGTHGIQGFVTEPLDTLLSQEKFDAIYTCGPEIMVKKIFELTQKHKQPLEASLERLMRCGIGLCGSCVIGKYRVCRDGTVFNEKQLEEIKKEIGNIKLDLTGNKIPI